MVYESIIQGMSSIASVYLSVIFITILVQKAVFVYKTQFFLKLHRRYITYKKFNSFLCLWVQKIQLPGVCPVYFLNCIE